MRLVACTSCHAHFDVAGHPEARFRCRCGSEVDATPRPAVDAPIHRCGSCGALVEADGTECGYCRAEIVRDESRRSLLCPECYARNEDTARFCTACGIEFRPQPPPGAAPALDCVDCGKPLRIQPVGGVPVRECGTCGGIWVADDDFDDLVRRAIRARRQAMSGEATRARPRRAGGNPMEAEVRYRRCPVCSEYMARRNYLRTSGVVVDHCREHGSWLDPDELEQIAGFIMTGGLERAAAASETTHRGSLAPGRKERASGEFARILMENRGAGDGVRRAGSFLEFLQRLLERPYS